MTIRVLGPMDIGGPSLSPRERTLLSALIVRRDGSMTAEELADALWADAAPPTWPQQVRNAIARIRSKLGRESIRTSGDTYRLGIAHDAIDAVRFETMIAQARRYSLEGAAERSAAEFSRALDMWRGAPYPDVAEWQPGRIEASRLVEVRANVQEELLGSRLRAGERASAVPDAELLVREQPLREHRWALLALANYRADRQGEAIAVLRAARSRLNEDLGIDPSHSLIELEARILRQDADLDAPAPNSGKLEAGADLSCPYLGLAAFDSEDAAVFFGRDGESEALVARCRPRSVLTITGPSGSGKSSLLRAGVVPRLREQGREVTVVTPDDAGIVALSDDTSYTSAVIAIDQAEELLTVDQDHFMELAASVSRWVDNGGCLILTLRSDLLDRATALPTVGPAVGRNVFAVPPLDPLMLRHVTLGPAEHAGLEIEPGLVEVIMRDAGSRPGILPPLSHALAATWARREGRTLTVAGYEAAGGIAGAIAQSAERVYSALTSSGQVACRSLMMRLVERTPEGATVRRRVPLATLTTDSTRRAVVERLVAARLMTIDGDAAIIAHEAVGDTWPRLDGWLREDAEYARVLRDVEAAAQAWDAGGREPVDLYRGSRLATAQEWRDTFHPDLTASEAAFLAASEMAHRAELTELAQRAAHERARNRRLRFALAASAILLIAALVSGGVAAVRGTEAALAAEDARIEALAATSLSIRDTDRDAAALLAAELYRRWPDDSRSRAALLGTFAPYAAPIRDIGLEPGILMNAAVIPGTRTALMVTDRPETEAQTGVQEVDIVDLDSGDVVRRLEVPLPRVDVSIQRDIVVSADGSTAFIQTGDLRTPNAYGTCCKNHLTAIDLATGTQPFPTVELDSRTNQKLAIAPDGSRAYFAHFVTGAPSFIDLTSGDVTEFRAHDPEEWEGVAGSRNGLALVDNRVAVGMGSTLEVYDAETLETIGDIRLGEGDLSEILLTPVGDGTLITVGDDGGARVDIATGEILWHNDVLAGSCTDGLVLPASRLLCLLGHGMVREHDLRTGNLTGQSFDTLSADNRTLGALPGGREFMTVVTRDDAAIQVWRADGMPSIATSFGEGHLLYDGFGMNGDLVIVQPSQGLDTRLLPGGLVPNDALPPMTLWDVHDDEPVGEPAQIIAWMSDSVVARAVNGAEQVVLQNVRTLEEYPLAAMGATEEIWMMTEGGPGPHAYAVGPGRIVAFDPATGERQAGTVPIRFPNADIHSITELPGSDRIAVTWWNDAAEHPLTSIHDLLTGEEVTRGLAHDSVSVGLLDGTLLSASGTRLVRSDADLTPLQALAKPGTAPSYLDVTIDGRTAIVVTFDQRIGLYDLEDGRRLGDDIVLPRDDDNLWPAGFLDDDGDQMVATAADGILLWDLRPAAMRDAACAMVGRQLTDVEWQTYVGDEPYAESCPAAAS